MQEETLYRQWQALARSGREVHTAGHRLRVLRAGRLNTWRGPDFVAARFELDGIIYQGDVECHSRTQDWYNHQHHLDRAYSQVLLHLVAAQAVPETVEHSLSGQPIPTLPLPEGLSVPRFACPFTRLPEEKSALLQQLALRRLQRKVRYFTDALAQSRPQVVFQRAFFRAMGYPHNADAFSQLAGRVFLPPAVANAFSLKQLYAIYAGQAGFLTAPADAFSEQLAAFYRRQTVLSQAPLPPQVWQFSAQRPGNHPHFRLAGALAFFKHYGCTPLGHALSLLSQRLPYEQLRGRLLRMFSISCDDYWQNHYALGHLLPKRRQGTYFGAARRAEVLINVIIPLSYAQAVMQGSSGFADYLEGLYLWWPATLIYGGLRRQFSWWKQARQQWPAQTLTQGLLELQQTHCSGMAGAACPLFEISCPIIDSQSKNDYTLTVPDGN